MTKESSTSGGRSRVQKVRSNWAWRAEPVAPGAAVVFDIDGVLADASGRQHFLSQAKADWTGFFEACGGDVVNNEIARLLALLDRSLTVVLLTGRPTAVRQITIDWFERNGLRWDLLIMRERGDYGASLEFKRQELRRLKSLGHDLQLGFEDDEQNREMFEAEGVPCVYVHSGYYADRDRRGEA